MTSKLVRINIQRFKNHRRMLGLLMRLRDVDNIGSLIADVSTLTWTAACLLLDTCACKDITQSHWADWSTGCWACTHTKTCLHSNTPRMLLLPRHFMAEVLRGTANCKSCFHNQAKSTKVLTVSNDCKCPQKKNNLPGGNNRRRSAKTRVNDKVSVVWSVWR